VVAPELRRRTITIWEFVALTHDHPAEKSTRRTLRLPDVVSASPNFAFSYLMASTPSVLTETLLERRGWFVEAGTIITIPTSSNAGLAAEARLRGTFGHEAEEGKEDKPPTTCGSPSKAKAHTAARGAAWTQCSGSDPASSGGIAGAGPAARGCRTRDDTDCCVADQHAGVSLRGRGALVRGITTARATPSEDGR